MGDLFPDLPEQHPPASLYTDAHALELCTRCGGTGTETCPYPTWQWERRLMWDPTCHGCHGAGKILRYVGRCTDA